MLFFFDETFRDSLTRTGVSLGAVCGVAIPEHDLARVTADVYQLKLKHFGTEFAKDHEIKGKDILKNWVFKLAEKGEASRNLEFATDLLDYLVARKLWVFGCVCFEQRFQRFQCEDMTALDMTFRYLFERVDMFMKIKHHKSMAMIVFDDRDYSINQKNSEAITNFFQRSAVGLSLDSIVKTPFFAISQSQNAGLQLADFVTTIIGLRFSGNPNVQPYFTTLRKCIFTYDTGEGGRISCLKVMRGEKEKAPGDLAARGRDKKAQLPAQG
ncbi:MAG: DUF3800 domain-containing protein [bacterium]